MTPATATILKQQSRSIAVDTAIGIARTAVPAVVRLLTFFSLAVLLQMGSGAFSSGFSGYPDEPSHYVTAVMVHDYITSGFPAPPMTYAEQYYQHYPKVAIGHWPPLFYLVQAGWILLFTHSRVSVLLLMATVTACLAYCVHSRARKIAGAVPGLVTCRFAYRADSDVADHAGGATSSAGLQGSRSFRPLSRHAELA